MKLNVKNLMLLAALFLLIAIPTQGLTSNVTSSALPTADSAKESTGIKTNAPHLIIVTRHDFDLYNAIAVAFAASDLGKSVGITSATNLDFKTPTTYEAFVSNINNLDVDVAWGGGPSLFNALQANNYLQPITDQSTLDWIAANVSDTIAGASMKSYTNSDLMWVASAISSFGFTINNVELQSRGLPTPKSWEDLASPDFFTGLNEANIAMGNAPDTTSNTRIYQIILQHFGWEKGWQIIYAMAGNSNIYDGSVATRQAVVSGETAVAMTIDFYGLIAQIDNPDTEYIIPANESSINGDPIALATGATELTAANAFIKFVLSQEGQSIMLDPKINRLPVREDAFDTPIGHSTNGLRVYDMYNKTIANQGISFDEDLALSLEEPMRYHFESTITNVHPQLRDTWAKLVTNYQGDAFPEERYLQLLDMYAQPAMTQAEAQSFDSQIRTSSTFRTQKRTEWQDFAVAKLDNVFSEIDKPYTASNSTYTPEPVDQGVKDFPIDSTSIFVGFIGVMVIYTYRKRRML